MLTHEILAIAPSLIVTAVAFLAAFIGVQLRDVNESILRLAIAESERYHDRDVAYAPARRLEALIRLVSVFAAALAFVACDGPRETFCSPDLQPVPEGEAPVFAVWCPGQRIEIAIDETAPCPEAMVRDAVARFDALGLDIFVRTGAMPDGMKRGVVTFQRIDSDRPVYHGSAQGWHPDGHPSVMGLGRIVVSECHAGLIAHEVGHALGFHHSAEGRDIMSPIISEQWERIDVSEASIDAYLLSQ